MLKTFAFALAVSMTILAGPAGAAIVSGGILGPDTNTGPQLVAFNDADSTVDITRIQLNGGTAASFPIIWDSAGNPVGPVGTVTFAGIDTDLLTINFAHFDPGEDFRLVSLDPDPANVPDPDGVSVKVSDLIGVEVLFTFSDNSTALYVLVDDPAPDAGLMLVPVDTAVPEPATLALFGAAVMGAVALRRRPRLGGRP